MRFRSILSAWLITSIVSLPALASAEVMIEFRAPGADKDLARALSGGSLIVTAVSEGTDDPQELVAASRADYARLLGILYQNGYFGGTINIKIDNREAANIPPLAAPATVGNIAVIVRPGPVYRFGRAAIGPLAPETEIPETFRPGAVAGTGAIEDAAIAAIEAWRSDGYAKARVIDQRITARHNARSVDASLTIQTGPEVRFGQISVSGNKEVRTKRINTIAGLKEGAEFDPEEIARAERRLRRTGSFRSVVVTEADNIGPGKSLPLDVSVVEQTPRRFGFGAEYSTVEGVGLSGFWLHRNLLGGAERFRIDSSIVGIGGETGGQDYDLRFRYERPATPRADVDLFATLGFSQENEPDYNSKDTDFTLGFTRYATDELVVEFGLGYLYSDVSDAFGREVYSLLTLPLSGTLDRRDNALNPTKGIFLDLSATPFYGLGDSDSGAQVKLDARGYRTFGEDGRVTAALRLQFGSLIGPELASSPPLYRFYSGGGGTVRGQDYQSLDVDIGGGNRSGGRSFAGLSAEARVGITDAISVVGFYDFGYVGAESFPDGSGGSHSGAGIGVRYNTGIGPIRLDVATPVSGGGSGVFLYVGIGQAF